MESRFYHSILAVLLLSLPLFSAQSMKVKEEGAFIYAKNEGDEKIAVMSKGEEIFLLEQGPQRSKIKAEGGFVGWALNSQLEFAVQDKGDVYNLDNQEIMGWLDNPTAVYILDHNPGSQSLLLTRDFSFEIFEFMDRETIERRNDEN